MSTQTKVTEKKPTPLTYVKKAIKIFINCNLPGNSSCVKCQIRLSLVSALEKSVLENVMIQYFLDRIGECRHYYNENCRVCEEGWRAYKGLRSVIQAFHYQRLRNRPEKREYGEEVEKPSRSIKKMKFTK